MDFDYLKYLGRLGAADIHPLGAAGTAALLLAAAVRPGMRVREIGCGTGQTLWRLRRRGARAVGVELLPEMLAAARARLAQEGGATPVSLVRGRGHCLPMPANTFDRALTESVLGFQDVQVATDMLSELWRVLRPGGLYVANEAIWKPDVSPEQADVINARALAHFGLRQASDAPWSVREWRQAMERAGFEVLSAAILRPVPAFAEDAPSVTVRINWRHGASPRLLWRRWYYRRRLRQHHADGQAIESRLFVLRKPEGLV